MVKSPPVLLLDGLAQIWKTPFDEEVLLALIESPREFKARTNKEIRDAETLRVPFLCLLRIP